MSDYPNPPADTRIKIGHLVMGLVFLGTAAVWGLHSVGIIGSGSGVVVLPLILVLAGLIGLVAMAAGGLRNRTRSTYVDHVETTQIDTIPNDTTTQEDR